MPEESAMCEARHWEPAGAIMFMCELAISKPEASTASRLATSMQVATVAMEGWDLGGDRKSKTIQGETGCVSQ